MTSVAVAVNGGARCGGKGSSRAVRWTLNNFSPSDHRFILVHVMPAIISIPTPSGERIPIEELDADTVALYVQEVKIKYGEIFIPYKKLCKGIEVETIVLEDDNPANALLRYASESGVDHLVLGSRSVNCILRKFEGPGIPENVLRYAPETCGICIIYGRRVITKSAHPSTSGGYRGGSKCNNEEVSGLNSYSSVSSVQRTFGALSMSSGFLNSEALSHVDPSTSVNLGMERDYQNLGGCEIITTRHCNSTASTKSEMSDAQVEVEQLQVELQKTRALYEQACTELVHAQNTVHLLSSECLEEARRVNAVLEREDILRKTAAEEKAKRLQTIKEVEEAKTLLAKEVYERQIAELNALKEFLEKQKFVDVLFSSDRRYRRYTRDEIEEATDFFSENRVIGEGGFGKVYKCSLDHTPVAVKVFNSDAIDKREEFLREVEVLGQHHHPNIVLLLGACPETGSLVYEYLENGSLEDNIFHLNGKPALSWNSRFRITFEVACGLSFLHNSKPEPIVHRDLKPGNILLDRNYTSKIGDVGLAKLISDIVPDNITEYRESVIAGTFYYMDPEYQRTGTLRPKSDLYAFGVIILQLLTARHPNGLLLTIEKALLDGSFPSILDNSITDWPLAETEELARIALKCSSLRCRDRPHLDTEVLPILKRLHEFAYTTLKAGVKSSTP
ncbi:U-box domain-containing protein 34 [Tripterygium wilfordii]|uniref:RING-type E3 ubiquitin transferase n=1 Tax=Tripterygium wilfordii TaxID=458696 RepID=A0A7J7DQ51_TRIWF|nr:U-box domain-containing protein 34 [Tripterygium wilfordii]